jgi:hypothetical protein
VVKTAVMAVIKEDDAAAAVAVVVAAVVGVRNVAKVYLNSMLIL